MLSCLQHKCSNYLQEEGTNLQKKNKGTLREFDFNYFSKKI